MSALFATHMLGCIAHLDSEQSPIGRIERDCLVPPPAGVEALDAPSSLEYPGRSLWVWEGVSLVDGSIVETPYAFVESADDVCSGGPQLAVDGAGRPLSLLSLSDSERAENESRTDGRRLVLVPRGGFVQLDVGYLFYDHLLRGPGLLDEENLGTGLCVLAEGAAQCARVEAPDGTRLFDPSRRVLNRGGLVADGRGLIYGCRSVATLQTVCTVTGAPLDALTDPAEYRVFDAFSGWQTELGQASSLVDELGPVTVAPYGDGYLMTVLDLFESRVYLRYAETPLGPFGRRVAAFDVVPTRAGFPGGGREHVGLRNAPHTVHLTYKTDEPSAAGLHLVTYRVLGAFWR